MESSSAAVSFGTLASLFAFCFGVSAPLTVLGVCFGKKEEANFENTAFDFWLMLEIPYCVYAIHKTQKYQ